MAFDVAGAYRAGYSEAEIADFLAQQVGFNTNAAKEAGYSDRELVNYLATNQPEGGFGAAFESGVAGVKSAGAALLGRTGVIDTATAEQYMAEKEAEQRMAFKPTEEGWLEAPLTKVGELAGGSLPFMAAPIVGAAAGAVAAGSAPAWLAAGLGSTALSALQFTGTNLERQIEEGKTLEETDLLKAGATAVPQALLDTVALRFIPGVRRLLGVKAKELTEAQLQNVAKRAIATNLAAAGAKTSSTEALTEVGQQALERFQASLQVLDNEGKDELIESAIGGGVLGFLFGVPGGVNVRGRARNKLAEAEAKRQKIIDDATAADNDQQAPQLPASTTEEARVQKQRAAVERFGLESDFPAEISPTGDVSRVDRQQAVQTSLDAQGRPAVDPVQGDLFLDAAQRARAEGAPVSEQQRLFDVGAQAQPQIPQADIATPETPAGAAPGQLALPLIGGRTASQVEIEKYLEEENTAAVEGARRTQTKRQEQGEQGAAQTEKDRLQFESDLAEVDGRVRSTQDKTVEDNRLELLLPILANPQITNIPKVFGRALQQAGVTDLDFNARERKLIERAYDVRGAAIPEPTVDTAPSTPNEMDVEGVVPERAVGAREPEQMGLPGVMGRGAAKRAGKTRPIETTAPLEPTALGPTPVVDEQALDTLKLPKASMLRKRLIGKDLSDPKQNQEVNTELRAALQNTKLPVETRTAIRDVVNQSAFTRQGEMFGPSGGVLSNTTPKEAPTAAPVPTAALTPPAAPAPTLKTATPSATPSATPTPTAPQGLTGAGKKLYDGYVAEVARAIKATPNDALKSLSVVTPTMLTPEQKVLENISADIYAGENTRAAKTVYAALPVEQKAQVDQFVNYYKGMENRANIEIARLNAIQEAAAELSKQVDADMSKLINVDAAPLMKPLASSVVTQLQNNNLVGALDELAGLTKGEVSRIAKKLAERTAGVNVQLVDNATMSRIIFERTGKTEEKIQGVYFAADNTTYINSDLGLDVHTLLHESTHSAVDSTLNNKAHPLTKQLQKVFDDVKDSLGSAYGATDLKEFAAEFMGNPEFRTALSTIYPQGGNISALRKVVDAISNFVRGLIGLKSKSAESAYDKAGSIIYSILEPGQTALQPTTTMQEYSYLRKGNVVLDAAANMYNNLPGLTEARKDKIDQVVTGTLYGGVKNVVKAALPLDALTNIATPVLPSAKQLNTVVNEKHGAENRRQQALEPIQNEATKFAKGKTLEQMTKFNNVVYSSTLAQVDPSKTRDTYIGNNDKLKAWDGMQAEWKSLGADGQRLYTRMRDAYAVMYQDILKVIEQRLDSATGDPAANARVKKDILARLANQAGNIEPYFPLTRKGDYWLQYTIRSKDGSAQEVVVEAFESDRARRRAMEDVQKDPEYVADSVSVFSNLKQMNYRDAPSGSFMNAVFTVMEANKVPADVTDQLMTLFVNSLPATSFAQSFQKRKGRLGFERDSIAAFREKTYSISRQLTNLEYAPKLNAIREQLRQEAETAARQGDNRGKEYYNEFDKRIDFAISPSIDKWSQYATSYGFAMTLGFNISSAVVNLSQVPLMVLPYYGGKYGYGASMRAIANATKFFMGSGTSQDRTTILGDKARMRAGPSIDNYDFDAMADTDPRKRYKVLAEEAGRLGQLNRSQVYDILDVDNIDNPMAKVNAISGFVFHHGERMNRQIALTAAYDLELGAMEKAGRKIDDTAMREAAQTATELTELTNSGIASAAAPRIAQNSLGRVMFMYKRYGVSMYYAMFKMARDALKDQDPEIRKAGMRQIAGIFLSAGMMSGVQGLPLFGVGALVYNLLKGDDEDDAETTVRKYLGEIPYKGLLNATFGADVASRVGLSDLLFRENPVKRDQEPMAEIMELIGGPVYSIGNRALRGIKDIQQGEVQRGLEQIMPSAFSNVLKTIRFSTEGVNTRRGDPILEEFGYGSAAAQLFGFAPAKYTRQLEINAMEKGKNRAIDQKRTKLLRQYNLAARQGDSSGTQDILKQIEEFNGRNPSAAINASTLRRSTQQFARTSSEMRNGVTYSKRYLPVFEESMREYGDDE